MLRAFASPRMRMASPQRCLPKFYKAGYPCRIAKKLAHADLKEGTRAQGARWWRARHARIQAMERE